MSSYAGQNIALLTQHGKERVIRPVLGPALGCTVHLVSGFDTDQLGTFTRDTPRHGSQLDAARRKARLGMELSGLSVGIASEGSFSLDPFTGTFPWNIEMLVLIDERRKIEITGMASSPACNAYLQTAEWEEVRAFAHRECFPDHLLVIRPQGRDDPRMHKAIADWDELEACFHSCVAEAENGQVFVEVDLRAFANPTRMGNIARAADNLLKRLQSLCPACDAPGYWAAGRQAGLPCKACGSPTQTYRSEVWQCSGCQYCAIRPRLDLAHADPHHCKTCNP